MISFRPFARLTLALALGLAGVSPGLAQEPGADETVAYQAWYAANAGSDQAKAIETAKAYLEKFPKGQYAEYLNTWMNAARLKGFDAAVQAKNTDEMLRLGREILAEKPDNLAIQYSIAFNLRRLEIAASPANFSHAKEASEFAASAISAIEAGKTIEGGQFNKDASLALLYQLQAMIAAKEGKTQEAMGLYSKSSAADPGNISFVAYNLLALAALQRGPYDAAAKAYQALPEADRTAAEPSPETKAALDAVYATADPLIDSWARFVALARARNVAADTREQVLAGLQAVYGTRHNGDVSGLEPLIEKLKAEYTPKG